MFTNSAEAHRVLTEGIAAKQATAREAIERVFDEVPQDRIIRGQALRFHIDRLRAPVGMPEVESLPGRVRVGTSEDDMQTLHHHALRQLGERASVPAQYVDKLMTGQPWQQDLLMEIFGKTYGHARGNYLVRSVKGQVRGVLSDKFRRLDSRPILGQFMQDATALGAQPYSGTVSDIKVAIKVLSPNVFEPVPGEWLAHGVEWSNSDFGAGKHSLREFVLRLVCLNGMTAEDLISQIHLGGKLSEELTFSEQTYRLDTETTISAVHDMVTHALSESSQQATMKRITDASEGQANWPAIKARMSKSLSKDELRKVDEAYTGPDVVNLPPGQTHWRLSNALSWVANSIESPERKLDFERMAGAVINPGKAGKAEPATLELEPA